MVGQRAGYSQFSLNIRRLRVTDPLVGLASLVVAGALFTPWFGVGVLSTTFTGISVHGYLVIPMLTALALVGVIAARIGWDPPLIKLRDVLLLGTGAQLAFVLIAFLIRPVGLTWETGAYVDVGAAVVAWGLAAIPDRRAR
jgi:hypothetical protein